MDPEHKNLLIDITAIVIASLMAFFQAFFNFDVTHYMDGGYYLLQVQTLVTKGHLYFEAPPLFFIVAFVCGGGELGLSIATALIIALQIPVYFSCIYVLKDRRTAYLTFPFVIWNIIFYRLYGDLAKNLIGLLFIPLLLICIWWSWQEKEETRILPIILAFFCSLGMITSHLPAALVGLISAGTLVIILIFNSLSSEYEGFIVQLKEIGEKLAKKNLRVLYNYPIIRIIIIFIIIAVGAVIGLLINSFFPVQPSTWYSSSEIPSASYGNSDSTETLILADLFKISLNQSGLIILALLAVILLRPRGWEVPISIFLAIMAIDFTIGNSGWTYRLDLNLEIGRILLLVLTLGLVVDGLIQLLKPKLDKLLRIPEPSEPIQNTNFHWIFTGITVLILILIVSHAFVIEDSNFVITESQREELKLIAETLQGSAYSQSETILFSQHGYEYWITVETGYETEKADLRPDFTSYIEMADSQTNRNSLLVLRTQQPLVVESIPLVSLPPNDPINGPWGEVMSPRMLSFFEEFDYSINMVFRPQGNVSIQKANATIWKEVNNSHKITIHQEALQIRPLLPPQPPNTYNIFNENTTSMEQMCSQFNRLLLNITVDFGTSGTPPFTIELPIFGGCPPFEMLWAGKEFRLLEFSPSFIMEEQSNQNSSEENRQHSHEPPVPQDPYSIWFLLPFYLFKGLYLRLLVAYPLVLTQFYILYTLIALSLRSTLEKNGKNKKNEKLSD